MDEARSRDHMRASGGAHPPLERAHSSDPHLNHPSRPAPPPGPPGNHLPPNGPPPPPHDMRPHEMQGRPKPSPATAPQFLAAAAAAAAQGAPIPPPPPHANGPDKPYNLHSFQEHEARAEALQVSYTKMVLTNQYS